MCHEHYKWAQRFTAPILKRFGLIFLHVDLKTEDVIATIHMCAFESAYKQSVSPFCTLFSRREIEQYEYFQVSCGREQTSGGGGTQFRSLHTELLMHDTLLHYCNCRISKSITAGAMATHWGLYRGSDTSTSSGPA